MENWKRRWKKMPTKVRQSVVALIGATIILVGIVLLPLPGPGWVIIFFGFAVLATEFAFAERVRDKLYAIVTGAVNWIKKQFRRPKR
jgi:uncharacterized protein (TIGR02611 family)